MGGEDVKVDGRSRFGCQTDDLHSQQSARKSLLREIGKLLSSFTHGVPGLQAKFA